MERSRRNNVCGCRRAWVCALAAAFLFPTCGLPPSRVPIDTILYERGASSAGNVLIVYLPGKGDSPRSVEQHGMVGAVRKRGIPADIVAVNAHLGYYRDGSIFRRLKEDVIDPARAGGYARIWLVGNSLGGYGSLAYLDGHASDVDGVVLLGPFVGDREILDEVTTAGGLRIWNPGAVPSADWKRRLMLLLKEYRENPGNYPPVYLGYGNRDRLAEGQRFLAAVLPQERVIELDGGHEWRTWGRIWELLLDRGIIK